MKLVFDNIIFSLQKYGGISVLWKELIASFDPPEETDLCFLEYKNAADNICRRQLAISPDVIYNSDKNYKICRYFNPKLGFSVPFIFCSSYYRIAKDINAINITIVHDFTYEYFRKGIAQKIHTWQKINAIKKADGVICISENTKKDVVKFIPDIDQRKIRVIHNGVSDDFFKIEDHNIKSEYIRNKLPHITDEKLILFVGNRASYKQFHLAIKATAKLKVGKYHLLIVGPNFTHEEQIMINKNLSIHQYTLLVGVDNTSLNLLYNCAFVFLYPSSYEGFGIPLLEAMKTGTPVIAQNCSSIPEVVASAGILLYPITTEDINKAINKLEDTTYYKMLSEKGIQQASEFNWSKTMSGYKEFFNFVLEKKGHKKAVVLQP